MTAARYLCLLVPLALVLAGGRAEREPTGRAAALLSFLAATVGLAALNELARPAGWYAFAPVEGSFRGMPVDVWIGWAALWGPVPVLLRRLLPLPAALGLLLWLDVLAMPALAPLVRLGPGSLAGELVGLAAVALPAQLLGRWTADRRHLRLRMLVQMAVFAAGTLWLVPTVVFQFGDGSWRRLTGLPALWLFAVAQVALLLAVPALAAVREFAVRGAGTPFPWDPPQRLVSTGPYAYLVNPMQVSTVALLLLLAALTGSLTLAAAAVAAAAFGAGVAAPHEHADLISRFGQSWRRYRHDVRAWWPRWTPHPPPEPARLWLDEGCAPCSATAAFLARRHPTNLTLLPASEHPQPLWRARYLAGDGHTEHGVAAIAHALDHVNLGYAYLGWLLRLPGIGWAAQLVTDAMIAPPHRPGTATGPHPNGPQGEECQIPSSGCSTERSRPCGSTGSRASPPGPSPPPPE